MRRPVTVLFIAAWIVGVAGTVLRLDLALLPAGAVLTAFGVSALRRRPRGGLVARALGVDVRSHVRVGSVLVIMLGVGWTASGLLGAVGA